MFFQKLASRLRGRRVDQIFNCAPPLPSTRDGSFSKNSLPVSTGSIVPRMRPSGGPRGPPKRPRRNVIFPRRGARGAPRRPLGEPRRRKLTRGRPRAPSGARLGALRESQWFDFRALGEPRRPKRTRGRPRAPSRGLRGRPLPSFGRSGLLPGGPSGSPGSSQGPLRLLRVVPRRPLTVPRVVWGRQGGLQGGSAADPHVPQGGPGGWSGVPRVVFTDLCWGRRSFPRISDSCITNSNH